MKDACAYCDCAANRCYCLFPCLRSADIIFLSPHLSLSLWIILSGCTAPGTGTAEPKHIVILHTAECKMSTLLSSPDGQVDKAFGIQSSDCDRMLMLFYDHQQQNTGTNS